MSENERENVERNMVDDEGARSVQQPIGETQGGEDAGGESGGESGGEASGADE